MKQSFFFFLIIEFYSKIYLENVIKDISFKMSYTFILKLIYLG